MQTFLPFANYTQCAQILDSKRLNKQVVEAYQLLTGKCGHKNHPASLMWEPHKFELKLYLIACSDEYTKRFHKIHKCSLELPNFQIGNYPFFIDDIRVQYSHRIRLLTKDYEYYNKFFPVPRSFVESCPEGYYWPVCIGKTAKEASQKWSHFCSTNFDQLREYFGA